MGARLWGSALSYHMQPMFSDISSVVDDMCFC